MPEILQPSLLLLTHHDLNHEENLTKIQNKDFIPKELNQVADAMILHVTYSTIQKIMVCQTSTHLQK